MSIFRKPKNALDEPVGTDYPGTVYLNFPIETNCPACQARGTTVFVYEMNKRDLEQNKIVGVKTGSHNCIPLDARS